MRLEKLQIQKRLGDLWVGALFEYKGTIALKSEYRNENCEPECYIVGSGEMFWGGKTSDLDELMVTPLVFR